MRKHLLFGLALSTLMGVSATVYAQEPVVMLHHNGEQTPFLGIDGLKQAYEAAVDNDTIYLPGGSFNQPSDYTKGIHIYGTGILPDSTKATAITTLNGQTRIRTGADNFHLEGVQGNSSIKFGNGKDTVSQIRIIGCKFAGIAENNTEALFTSVQLIQCIFTASMNFAGIKNSTMRNSIFCSADRIESTYNTFENNVIICSYGYYSNRGFNGSSNVLRNNAILYDVASGDFLNGKSNSLYNNTNCNEGTDCAANENPYTVPATDLFVNYTGVTFSFEQDFHLKNPELYLGTDGTQVGIYGGEYAWPDAKAVLPSNPHIRAFNTSSNTDENGMLQINVKVGAQN